MSVERYDDLRAALEKNSELVEQALEGFCSDTDADFGIVMDAERYSLLGGGKRIRPFIVNEFCRVLGGDIEASMPLACALEMIHTYSLIHDDLPCMDDDDMRRGKPSNHKKFGYANALLAGDALLTRAFETVASADSLSPAAKAEAVRLLARAAGDRGMIGGQIIDLDSENKSISFEKLLKLHSLKTGALIACAAKLGCIAAGFGEESKPTLAAVSYAEKIGIAFQAVDDMLDVTSNAETLGKNIGSDKDNGKTTFLTFFDLDGTKKYAKELTEQAKLSLSDMADSKMLIELADYLLERRS
jgi:geranylgeranyl diphosphate synthase type II